jgi:hypothetical protein
MAGISPRFLDCARVTQRRPSHKAYAEPLRPFKCLRAPWLLPRATGGRPRWASLLPASAPLRVLRPLPRAAWSSCLLRASLVPRFGFRINCTRSCAATPRRPRARSGPLCRAQEQRQQQQGDAAPPSRVISLDTGGQIEQLRIMLLSEDSQIIQIDLAFPMGLVFEAASGGGAAVVAEVTPGGAADAAGARAGPQAAPRRQRGRRSGGTPKAPQQTGTASTACAAPATQRPPTARYHPPPRPHRPPPPPQCRRASGRRAAGLKRCNDAHDLPHYAAHVRGWVSGGGHVQGMGPGVLTFEGGPGAASGAAPPARGIASLCTRRARLPARPPARLAARPPRRSPTPAPLRAAAPPAPASPQAWAAPSSCARWCPPPASPQRWTR